MRFLHFGRLILGIAITCGALAFAASVNAQTPASTPAQSPIGDNFEPLNQWTKAVLAGDRTALKQLYLFAPNAYAQTPEGRTNDLPGEESAFWSKFAADGLVGIEPKILEQTMPQADAVEFVLRVELSFESKDGKRKSVVSSGQIWVRQQNVWHIAIAQRGEAEPMRALRLPEPKVPNTHLYPEPSAAHKDLDVALEAAKAEHKRVLVIFGANWCYDCHVLDATLRSKDAAALVAANYEVIHVNIADGDGNGDLAQRFQIPLEKGIPSLAVVNGDGSLVVSQKQGEFQSAEQIGMEDVLGFLNRWKAPAAQ